MNSDTQITTNKKIRMIALDLDGTTLRNDKSISAANESALEEAGSHGIQVVIATGRTFDALPESILNLKCVTYYICSNGATIYDAKTGKLLSESCLDPDAVQEMVALVKEKNYMFESFTEGKAYIGRDYYEAIRDRKLLYRGRDYVLATRRPVDDIYEFTLLHKEHIENLNVFFPTQEEKKAFGPLLSEIPNATLTSSLYSNYELGGINVSKGNALEYVMGMCDIEASSLMAAGDSPNDISMLRLAGISIAVENSTDDVKRAADHVVPANDKDGIAYAVREYALR